MNLHLDLKDWLTIGATAISPILAVQVQKYLERIRESRQRKLSLFYTLMATRANRVSPEHVQALNMIDIEFGQKMGIQKILYPNKYKLIIDAWKIYHDSLESGRSSNNLQVWIEKNDDLFFDLLFIMAISLGYEYDRVMLKRRAYTPVAHGDQEQEFQQIRKGLSQIVTGNASLPVYFVNLDQPAETPNN